jgi:ABC-type Fe3+ transport system substrate-binding protein
VKIASMEQLPTSNGYAGVALHTQHPHAAALFADYLFSEAGQQVRVQSGQGTVRNGVKNNYPDYTKFFTDTMVPAKGYQAEFKKWADLQKELFIKGQK